MSYLNIKNVKIKGIAACVPNNVMDNLDYSLLSMEEREKYVKTTGVRYRHCADSTICTSDLCQKAAEKLIIELGWDRSEIEALIFVSQTTDYKMPATACILQEKLGLSNSCLSFDISMGCTAFTYGLSTIASIVSASKIKKALLLVGNTQSKNVNFKDTSSYLLFGDTGTATAIEYNEDQSDILKFNLQTYGDGANSIIIPDGGYRNPINHHSMDEVEDANGNIRSALQLKMDGVDVFSFVMSKVAKCFRQLHEEFNISDDTVDYYLLHQANKFMCEKLRKKLKYSADKVPYNIENFGNSSGATVPLLMVTNLREELQTTKVRSIISGFGVGLSIGVGYITTDRIIIPELMFL